MKTDHRSRWRPVVLPNLPAVASFLLEMIPPRGRVALSLGSTFKPLLPYWIEGLKERHAEFFPVDERRVPLSDPQSNWGELTRLLFAPISDCLSPSNQAVSAAEYEALLRVRFNDAWPVLDLVLLGLGSDGHTASLFPGQNWDNRRPVLETASPLPPHPRVTLSPRTLSLARTVAVVVLDPAKSAILKRVLDLEPGLPLTEIVSQREETVLVTLPGLLP